MCKEVFLWDLYITLFSFGSWREFQIALCCSTGEKGWAPKGSERELRTKRSLISEADVCPERMKNKSEWCEAGEKVTGPSVISAKRDKTFLSSDVASESLPFSHNATLYHHFWSVTWQPAPGYTLPNGISGKLVTKAISCGCDYAWSQPCAAYISQPSDSLSFPSFALSQPRFLIQQPLLFLSSSATTLPRLHQAINHTQSTLKMD